jgi:hypothetical protein
MLYLSLLLNCTNWKDGRRQKKAHEQKKGKKKEKNALLGKTLVNDVYKYCVPILRMTAFRRRCVMATEIVRLLFTVGRVLRVNLTCYERRNKEHVGLHVHVIVIETEPPINLIKTSDILNGLINILKELITHFKISVIKLR